MNDRQKAICLQALLRWDYGASKESIEGAAKRGETLDSDDVFSLTIKNGEIDDVIDLLSKDCTPYTDNCEIDLPEKGGTAVK